VVGVVGGDEDLGEGEDLEGVGLDGGGGFGGQAAGPVGGIQAVEELDAAGGVLEGAEAADAEPGGVAGSAEGPQAQPDCSKVRALRVIRSATVSRGTGSASQSQRANWGVVPVGVEGGESRSPTGVRSRRAVSRVGAIGP